MTEACLNIRVTCSLLRSKHIFLCCLRVLYHTPLGHLFRSLKGTFAKDALTMFSPADILLVEDEPAIAELMVRILRRAGYTVRVVMDGTAALAALADDPPAIMILDLVLPRMSGWAVLDHLHRNHYQVPVIIMTANPSVSARLSGYRIQQYLVKPFLRDELLGAIDGAYQALQHY
jgi:CheY-like chemotaxis protein